MHFVARPIGNPPEDSSVCQDNIKTAAQWWSSLGTSILMAVLILIGIIVCAICLCVCICRSCRNLHSAKAYAQHRRQDTNKPFGSNNQQQQVVYAEASSPVYAHEVLPAAEGSADDGGGVAFGTAVVVSDPLLGDDDGGGHGGAGKAGQKGDGLSSPLIDRKDGEYGDV
jgi:hypothetical protein